MANDSDMQKLMAMAFIGGLGILFFYQMTRSQLSTEIGGGAGSRLIQADKLVDIERSPPYMPRRVRHGVVE